MVSSMSVNSGGYSKGDIDNFGARPHWITT